MTKIWPIIMIIALSLFGCGANAPRPAASMIAPEDITSVSIGYGNMARMAAYSFTLKERDGEVLFSCYYFDRDADYEEITLEDVPVDAKYMDELRVLVDEYGFLNMKYKKPGILASIFARDVRDAPSYRLELGWPRDIEGRTSREDSLYLNYFPTGASEVEALMRGIAASVKGGTYRTDAGISGDMPNAQEDIAYLSMDYNHAMAGYGYSYTLEEGENGTTLFSCDNFYDYSKKKVRLDRIAVDQTTMDRLREIAAEHELVRVLREEPDQAETRPDAPQYSMRIYLQEDAEGNTPHYYVHYYPPGADELLVLFEELARAYEDIPTITH